MKVESVPVVERFEGQTAWQGTVEVFDLIGHPTAKRAYEWTYRDGKQNKTNRGAGNSACGFAAKCCQSGDCEQGRALDLPTVGQAADNESAKRSDNKNWSVCFSDDRAWQT